MRNRITCLLAFLMVVGLMGQGPEDLESKGKIVNTPHNLTSITATSEDSEVILTDYSLCRSCHVPHKANAVEPLWYRKGGVSSFNMEKEIARTSNHIHPLDPGSRNCLGCHDGAMAPSFPQRDQDGRKQINMTSNDIQAPPNYNLHLFSFPASGVEISPPAEESPLQLLAGNEVGCITCHDPHNNDNGSFLRVTNDESAICMECHQMQNWEQSTHGNPQSTLHIGLEKMACMQCHEIHTLPANAKLLKTDENTLCLGCHDGSKDGENEIASLQNLEETFEKPFAHPIRINPNVPGMGYDNMDKVPWNFGLADDRTIRCGDCHNPHAASKMDISPVLDGSIAFVKGVDAIGFKKSSADYEYEVCYKCHGQNQNVKSGSDISRYLMIGNRSFHPIENVGMNVNVPSLKDGWSEQSLITCSDCHGNDDKSGPQGPHGSSYPNILKLAYTESPFASIDEMALCASCHDPRIILGNDGFKFHSLHIKRAGYSCGACHNPHGSADNAGLIDLNKSFITDLNGIKKVETTDPGHGTCTLKCHDVTHRNDIY